MFKAVYWFVVIMQFILTVAIIIVLAVNRDEIIGHCSVSLEGADTALRCEAGFKFMMIAFSLVAMLMNFIQVQKF